MQLTNDTPTPKIGDRVLARSRIQHAYRLRLATSQSDIRAAQTLRFLVFNLELNEGLERSFDTCRDADPFDDICDHLLVEHVDTGDIVGTYRVQTGLAAGAGHGYYSAQEFDFGPYESHRREIIELGRACVHNQHRNLVVLSLLWKGIAAYAREHGGRYLMGCSSISSVDPAVGSSIYSELMRRHLPAPEWMTAPRPQWVCPLDQLLPETPKVPKLFSAYLSLGAKICGPPALDREFRTIDFLTLLDLDSLSPTVVQRYLS